MQSAWGPRLSPLRWKRVRPALPANVARVRLFVASALNLLTSRTKVDTVICLQTRDAEVFLHHGETDPSAVRMRLSVVFNELRRLQQPPEQPPASSASSAIDEIARLGDLLERGLIDDGEFSALKAKLIG
jgi:hypothetical protein